MSTQSVGSFERFLTNVASVAFDLIQIFDCSMTQLTVSMVRIFKLFAIDVQIIDFRI